MGIVRMMGSVMGLGLVMRMGYVRELPDLPKTQHMSTMKVSPIADVQAHHTATPKTKTTIAREPEPATNNWANARTSPQDSSVHVQRNEKLLQMPTW